MVKLSSLPFSSHLCSSVRVPVLLTYRGRSCKMLSVGEAGWGVHGRSVLFLQILVSLRLLQNKKWKVGCFLFKSKTGSKRSIQFQSLRRCNTQGGPGAARAPLWPQQDTYRPHGFPHSPQPQFPHHTCYPSLPWALNGHPVLERLVTQNTVCHLFPLTMTGSSLSHIAPGAPSLVFSALPRGPFLCDSL